MTHLFCSVRVLLRREPYVRLAVMLLVSRIGPCQGPARYARVNNKAPSERGADLRPCAARRGRLRGPLRVRPDGKEATWFRPRHARATPRGGTGPAWPGGLRSASSP